jgi:CRP-like cAMP-binding protein
MNPAAKWYFESQELYKMLCGDTVYNAFTIKTFAKNENLYSPGDHSNCIYFVKKGRIKIYYYNDYKAESIKAILSAGEIFGELALSGEEKRSEYAMAMDRGTMVYCCTYEDMLDIMEKNPGVSLHVVRLIGLRMLKMERKVELFVLKDARQRVIEFLRDAAEWKGKKVGTETLIETPLTHSDLAKLIGLSRQMLTVLLNELKRENIIYFDRRRILIRDISHFH